MKNQKMSVSLAMAAVSAMGVEYHPAGNREADAVSTSSTINTKYTLRILETGFASAFI
jgi:hypothetical protein